MPPPIPSRPDRKPVAAPSPAIRKTSSTSNDFDSGLAFDDFGVGQTRLDHLPKVHPDYLKFDISLIRSIHQASGEHQNMVANLVRMTKEMGIVSLAEGVETKEEHEACAQLGFDLVQGYFIGRPVPYQELGAVADGETT